MRPGLITALLLCLGLVQIPAAESQSQWKLLPVPGCWEDTGGPAYDGIAWYRCFVRVPGKWGGKVVTLAVERVDNAHEAFFNGARVGGAGHFPPDYQNGVESENRYVVPGDRLKAGQWNVIAVRIHDQEGRGGFKGIAPQLGTDTEHIELKGAWQFRTGDDASWASSSDNAPDIATFADVVNGAVPAGSRGHEMASRSSPLSPSMAAQSFKVPDDLEFQQVLAEPVVAQPVFLNFDERGRMWVVQYRQYPAPAGLQVVSKDVFWRAVYDRVPEPPPRGVKGLDRITIHEDTDGDGTYDRHKTFVDGLNIATACVKGRGGVWVLNPPYLLFYPDRNDDDVPDGDPEVRLEGFGLEDTHSVVNSLRWGPDGWLYAAQGSTVTGRIRRPGETNQVYSQGQNIWRYHPETRRYEIFSEGGGNAFGLEIDAQGRIFSGHNGGDTRGFHYAQGAYLRKGFEKHGELGNPYAFGYFPQMTGTPGERFTHNFVIDAGGALPERYRGRLFGVEPLQGRVVLSEIQPAATTFVTRDIERVVTSSDSWFRPVDIKSGPDGAIYVADWYDRQVTHTRNQEGNIDAGNGRIYRLKSKGAPRRPMPNLGAMTSVELVRTALRSENLWIRQTALRILGDRRDASIVPALRQNLSGPGDQLALESLWALNLTLARPGRVCNLPEDLSLELLRHPNRQVRIWTARLLGDEKMVSANQARELAALVSERNMSEVRAQLASTARRLPAPDALPMIAGLLAQSGDVNDARLPQLIWWALEDKCTTDPEAVLRFFEDSSLWFQRMSEKHILERLMRRFAAAGSKADLLACARLFDQSPSREHSGILMRGFELAFQGRTLTGLPDELLASIGRQGVGSEPFRVRQKDPAAMEGALRLIQDRSAKRDERIRFLEVFGEIHPAMVLDGLLSLAEREADPAVRTAALNALSSYEDRRIPETVLRSLAAMPDAVRPAALTLLNSRAAWARALVEAIDGGGLPASIVPREFVQRLRMHEDARLTELLTKHWPGAGRATSAAMQAQVERLGRTIRNGRGDPYSGKKLFQAACASCHKLFGAGGEVGPELTTYPRSDVDALLLQVINPSAEIREGYENILIETTDDRSLTGFLVRRDGKVTVLRGPDGQSVSIEQKDIKDMRAAGLSLMPEGLLDALEEQQVRDLFAYLRSTQPLAN